MPKEKYKVHEVAKDFGLGSKDILEILAKYIPKERKHSTVLDDGELDYVFDAITQKTAVESFDAYVKAGEKRKEQRDQPEKVEPQTETIAETPTESGEAQNDGENTAKKPDGNGKKESADEKSKKGEKPAKSAKSAKSEKSGKAEKTDKAPKGEKQAPAGKPQPQKTAQQKKKEERN